jgi:hypothetical protein
MGFAWLHVVPRCCTSITSRHCFSSSLAILLRGSIVIYLRVNYSSQIVSKCESGSYSHLEPRQKDSSPYCSLAFTLAPCLLAWHAGQYEKIDSMYGGLCWLNLVVNVCHLISVALCSQSVLAIYVCTVLMWRRRRCSTLIHDLELLSANTSHHGIQLSRSFRSTQQE